MRRTVNAWLAAAGVCVLLGGCWLTRAGAQAPGGREKGQGSQAVPPGAANPAGPGEIKFRVTRRSRRDQAAPAPDPFAESGRTPFVLDPGEAGWTLQVNDNAEVVVLYRGL